MDGTRFAELQAMKNHKHKLALVCGLFAASLVSAQATYDLPRLEALAMSSSRSVMAAREQVTAARYAVDSAGAFPNPEVEFLAGTARSRGAGGNPGDARSVALTQPLARFESSAHCGDFAAQLHSLTY